ncbi:MAG: hypothetical protein ACTHJ6_09370 [Oryzihumus sp.]
MSPDPAATVGNAAARAVHGLSAGADLALIGCCDAAPLRGELAGAGVQGAATVITGAAAEVLEQLADLAESDPAEVLVVAAADLKLSLPAVLDLLDKPGVRTGVLTATPEVLESGRDVVTRARVGGDGKLVESVGTAVHEVTRPNRALPGLLRVDPTDRLAAARTWRGGGAADGGGGGEGGARGGR